jgi:hypothetical protein
MALDGPILPRLPTGQRQLVSKYDPSAPLFPFLSGLSSPVQGALQNLDTQRVNMGQNPLTARETLYAGTAAQRQQSVVGEPDQPWYKDAATDLQTIASSIPKIPFSLIGEAKQLPDVPRLMAEATSKSTNPIEQVGNLAQVPGLRLIPGSFIASQFGTGGQGIGGLTEHPLFTALDVLPYAEKAARLTSTVKTAEELAAANAKTLGTLPEKVRPISTVLTRGFKAPEVVDLPGPFGIDPLTGESRTIKALEPNALGRAVDVPIGRLEQTKLGELRREAFGRNSREMQRQYNRASGNWENWTEDPSLAPEHLQPYAQQLKDYKSGLLDEYATIDPARQAEIRKSLTLDQPLENATPIESEYMDWYKGQQQKFAQAKATAGELTAVPFDHGVEFYDQSRGQKILKARNASEKAQVVSTVHDALKNPDNLDVTQGLMDHFSQAMRDDSITLTQRNALARGYMDALEQRGIDVSPLHNYISDYGPSRRGTGNMTMLRKGLNKRNIDGFITKIDETLADPTRFPPNPNLDVSGSTKMLTDTWGKQSKLNAVVNNSRRLEAASPSARWDDIVRTGANDKIVPYVSALYAGSDDLGKMIGYATDGLYRQIPELTTGAGAKFVRDAQAEIRKSWQDLADQGMAPTFVHNVDPNKAYSSIGSTQVLDHPVTPSSLKNRSGDVAPMIHSPVISLTSEAAEFLKREASQQFVDNLVSTMGQSGRDVINRLEPQYRQFADANLGENEAAALAKVIAKEGLTRFDPNAFLKGTASPSNMRISDSVYLPTEVVKNLERLKPSEGGFGTLLETPAKVFRTSVLALSPRWHVNNIIGGFITTMLRADNPLTIWRYTQDAYRMMKEGGLGKLEGEAGQLMAPEGATRLQGEFFKQGRVKGVDPTSFMHATGAGTTLRRLLESDWAQRARQAGSSIVEKSYNFNAAFDDFYKSLSYLEGEGRGLAKGMSKQEAIKAGISRARDMMIRWDTLTPLERESMRMVMPFYSWTNTVMKYLASYPSDHPWRTSFISSLAQAEQDDMASGIPQKLRGLLFYGDPDINGNVKAINLQGANPFKDVANYATLLGFVSGGEGDMSAITSQLNPAIGTALQAMGVNTMSGSADLYPDLHYDSMTGQLTSAPTDNLPLMALNNYLPQSRALTSLAGWSKDFRAMAKSDPAAASRLLRSSLGVPVMERNVNIPTEIAKQEVRLLGNQDQVKNDAMRTGDYDAMDAYPGLRIFKQRLEALSPNVRQSFTPNASIKGGRQPTVAELGIGAIRTQ